MSRVERVCLFCSVPEGNGPLLQGVRDYFPHAHVIGLVRPDAKITPKQRAYANEMLETTGSAFSARRISGLIELTRNLRALKCDHLIVMFDSLKLRIFCVLSGARSAECWRPDGKIVVLPTNLLLTLLQLAWYRSAGTRSILGIAYSLYLRPPKPLAKRD